LRRRDDRYLKANVFSIFSDRGEPMGLFDFLFGSRSASKSKSLDDKLWMTRQAKLNGIREELAERSASGSTEILLVAHFADVLQDLHAIAVEQPDLPVQVILAKNALRESMSRANLDKASLVDVIVAERHPLFDEDDKLIKSLQELPCPVRVVYHLSLEDPLLAKFAGPWVTSMLKTLGMSEDKSIENKTISRGIKEAQKKFQQQALRTNEADSAAEWIKQNLPG